MFAAARLTALLRYRYASLLALVFFAGHAQAADLGCAANGISATFGVDYGTRLGSAETWHVIDGGLPDDEEARAIVRATVDMAHALKIAVCAEGVESWEALDYLESVSCDRAQGHLIGRAVSADEFERIVQEWNATGAARDS